MGRILGLLALAGVVAFGSWWSAVAALLAGLALLQYGSAERTKRLLRHGPATNQTSSTWRRISHPPCSK